MREITGREDVDSGSEDDVALRPFPDLGGVPVEDASGIHAGQLFGALAEADSGLLRYLDLELDTLDRHVLVPIGHARILEPEPERARVRLRAALLEELEQVPPFPADVAHITDPFERALLEAYGRTFHGERYYAHPAYDHDGLYVGPHPVVGPGSEITADEPQLNALRTLDDWRVADGEADIRGWNLELDGEAAGTIDDLIIDPLAAAVRYVVITLDGESEARLLPIGYLRLDRAAERVAAIGLARADVRVLPAYGGGPIPRTEEERIHGALHDRLTGRRRYQLADYQRRMD